MPYKCTYIGCTPLNWRHNGHDGVSNHQPHDCLLDRLSGRRSKKTSKLRVTRLCAGNSLLTGEFSAQMASNTENVSIWWRHHAMMNYLPYHGKTCITQRPLCIIPPTFIFWFHDIKGFFYILYMKSSRTIAVRRLVLFVHDNRLKIVYHLSTPRARLTKACDFTKFKEIVTHT